MGAVLGSRLCPLEFFLSRRLPFESPPTVLPRRPLGKLENLSSLLHLDKWDGQVRNQSDLVSLDVLREGW
jgi:hypothetical protein